MTIHLSFPDWLGNFLGGTFHTGVYVLFAVFIISLMGEAWSEPPSMASEVDNCIYDPTSDKLKKQDEERRQREENEARMRGAQHNYNSAMRGGNFAQARNSKQDMENIAAKLK